jgi:hypothetical protein
MSGCIHQKDEECPLCRTVPPRPALEGDGTIQAELNALATAKQPEIIQKWLRGDLQRICYEAARAIPPRPAPKGDRLRCLNVTTRPDILMSEIEKLETELAEAKKALEGDALDPQEEIIRAQAVTITSLEAQNAQFKVFRSKDAKMISDRNEHIASLSAQLAEARKVLEMYRAAVRVDVLMEGPRFSGSNIQRLREAWEFDRLALADK